MSIDGQDAHHITHVLRMKLGEQLQIVSLDQVAAVMKITGFGENRVDLALVETLEKRCTKQGIWEDKKNTA